MIPTITLLCTFMIIYISLYFKINKKMLLLLKTATSACFVLLGILAYFHRNDRNYYYFILIFIGLVCGFFGDILLGLRHIDKADKKKLFIAGMALFLLGHICYAGAFLALFKKGWLMLCIFVAVIIIAAGIAYKRHFIRLHKTGKAISAYLVFLCTVLVIAAINVGYNPNTSNMVILIGAASFIISDIILYIIYFANGENRPMKCIKTINIITYYLAESLFAISTALI